MTLSQTAQRPTRPPPWVRLRNQVRETGWQSAPLRLLRWAYWTLHLDFSQLHTIPSLRDPLYFDGLEQTAEGRAIVVEVLGRTGEHFRVFAWNDLTLKVDLNDQVVGRRLYVYHEWEPYETKLFLQAVRPGMTVLDLGAHIGCYALLAARALNHSGKVLAFEPVRLNYELLSENVRLNHFENTLIPVQLALSDHAHAAEMYLAEVNGGDHRMYPTSSEDDRIFNRGMVRPRERVQTIAVDTYLQEHHIKTVDLIKMDVQGAELAVLRGMEQTLRSNPDVLFFFEYWYFGLRQAGTHPQEPLALLQNWGFEFWQIDPEEERIFPVTLAQAVETSARLEPTQQVDMIAARSAERIARRGVH